MALDIPTVLQTGDREDALGRILEATEPLAALLSQSGKDTPIPAEILSRYRCVVNQVHPDRCPDPRAASALERASLAFDALCAAESCRTRVASRETSESWLAEIPSMSVLPAGCRWWHLSDIGDLDRLLEHRSATTQVLCHETAATLDLAGLQRLQLSVSRAEKACVHLDRGRGFTKTRLWSFSGLEAAPTSSTAIAAEATRVGLRLVDLICHLRAVHRFCFFHERTFDHKVELEAVSTPAAARKSITKLLLAESRTNIQHADMRAGPLISSTSGPDDAEVDSLDAFMTALDVELSGAAINSSSGQDCTALGAPQTKRSRVATSVSLGAQDSCQAHTPDPSLSTSSDTKCNLTQVSSDDSNALGSVLKMMGTGDVGSGSIAAELAQGLSQRPKVPPLGAPMKLATGSLVPLPVAAAAAKKSQDAAIAAAQIVERVVQDDLLGDLASDESELEDDK